MRDNYEIPGWPRTDNEKRLLMITTDRVSAFDVVMSQGVPELGKIRNQISIFWFERLRDLCPNHIFSSDQQLCADTIKAKYREANDLIGRCVLVYPAKVFKVECVVRGYLAGSAWESYRKNGTVCGIEIRPGPKEAEKLSQPIFTPTTKAAAGHDKPITFDKLVKRVGGDVAEELREKSLKLYTEADRRARIGGIIIADTKFEFGVYNGRIILIDELLTPDSSRFWDVAEYKPGRPQPSFDKQPLRDWLSTNGWNREPPAPDLPDEVIKETRERYIKAFEMLTRQKWPPKF